MTGPTDGDDWDFPEVDPADPASTALPGPEAEPVYDTGSDAWWRAQASAQREAATTEQPGLPVEGVPAEVPVDDVPELVEPQVLLPDPPAAPVVPPPAVPAPDVATPLDRGWLPDDLAADPLADPEPPPAEPVRAYVPPVPVAAGVPVPVVPEPVVRESEAQVTREPPAAEGTLRDRPVPEPPPVGPLRALAGAGLAVAGVALGIGALLVFTHDDPQGNPVVASPPTAAVSGPPTAAPSAEPPTATPVLPSPPATTPVAPPVAPPASPSAPPATTGPAAPVVPVSVLNNSRVSGLADRSAARFRAGGWPVRTTGNYSGGTIPQTTVYYPPGQQASAQRFAKQFGIPRVRPRFSGIPTSGMTVIVTRDYA